MSDIKMFIIIPVMAKTFVIIDYLISFTETK